jgi:hypothetical protein
MAGNHSDHSVHRIVSGETPVVGLEVIDNNLDRGVITEVATDEGCGWYCNAWHRITYPDGSTSIMNCDRLTTRMPR